MTGLQIGFAIDYAGARVEFPWERVKLADRLGYHSVWTGEAYGSDAMTPLAYVAALTKQIKLGTGIIQIGGRTPANAVMQAQTIDGMSRGRMILGIGVSGPQIIEGWYGTPWGKPLDRLRDYTAIMRKIQEREGPVTHDGPEYKLPYAGPGSSGLGKPLHSILHMRRDMPIWLGSFTAGGLRLAGEISDGVYASFVPSEIPAAKESLEEGFAKAGNGKSWDDFTLFSRTHVIVTNDVKAALDSVKPHRALYIGGMGARSKNFHNERIVRRGYPEVAKKVQDLFLAGRKDEAIAALPDELIDEEVIVGPPNRIREKFRVWQDLSETGLDGLVVVTQQDEAIELIAELADTRANAPA